MGVATGLRALPEAAAGTFRVRFVAGALAVTVLSAAKVSGALPVVVVVSDASVFLAGFLGLGAVIGGISFSVVAVLLRIFTAHLANGAFTGRCNTGLPHAGNRLCDQCLCGAILPQ